MTRKELIEWKRKIAAAFVVLWTAEAKEDEREVAVALRETYRLEHRLVAAAGAEDWDHLVDRGEEFGELALFFNAVNDRTGWTEDYMAARIAAGHGKETAED